MKTIILNVNDVVMINAVCWQGARSVDHSLPSFTPGDDSQWREMQEYLKRESRQYVIDSLECLIMAKDATNTQAAADYASLAKSLRNRSLDVMLLRLVNILQAQKGCYSLDFRAASYMYYCVNKLLSVIDGEILTNDEAVQLRMNLTYCLEVSYRRTGRIRNDDKLMRVVNYGLLTEDGHYRIRDLLKA